MATFNRYTSNGVTTATSIHQSNASDASQADIIIGFSIANAHTATVTVDAYVHDGTNNIYLCKQATIPVGGAIEVINGKIVLDNNDNVYVTSDNAVDVWLSVLDNASA